MNKLTSSIGNGLRQARGLLTLLTAVFVLAFASLLPVQANQPWWMTVLAKALEQNPSGCEDCPVAGPAPVCTGKPIAVNRGEVIERATDASLPGTTLGFSHTRIYGSRRLSAGVTDLPALNGVKWEVDSFSMFLAEESGGDDVILYSGVSSKRTFVNDGMDNFTAPADYRATLEFVDGSPDEYVLTMTDSGEVYTFHGFDVDDKQKGLLKSQTDRYGNEELTYTFDGAANYGAGRITSVTTSQGWSVVYTYLNSGVNNGRIQQIDVKNGSNQVIQRVKYTYKSSGDGNHSDTGTDGDLIMVDVLRRASGDNLANSADGDFSIRHVTQYRYYRDADSDGKDHLMKLVLHPGDIERITSAGNGAVDTPEEILTQADTYVVTGSNDVKYYRSYSFTYYTSDVDTSNVATPWATENLHMKYGGAQADEADATEKVYLVKTETVLSSNAGGGCCGGGTGGLTRTYFYMDLDQGPTPAADEVTRIVIEDTEDSVGGERYRKTFGLNSQGHKLREIFISDPTQGILICWAESTVVGTTGNELNRVKESRMTSAHTLIDTDAEVAKFLDPRGGTTPGDNDNDTVHASAGLIYVYTYNADGYRTDTQVKQGRTGTAYYVSATDYGDGSDHPSGIPDDPTRLPVATYVYRDQTVTRGDGIKTEYRYTFWDGGDTQLKTVTVTLPAVPTTENGSNIAIVTKQYFDQSGRLRWTKDGEGYVNYYAYHPDTGGLAYVMVDVETDDLPAAITAGSAGKWIEWDDGASGDTIPTGFENTADNARQLVSKMEFDDLGRIVKAEDAKGVVTYTVYGDNVVYVFPAWDTGTDRPLLPIQVARTDDAGNITETFTVDPARTALDGNDLPTGLSGGTSQAHYVTWSRLTYNDHDQLLFVDAYHDIPSSGTGTLTTNYHRTAYRYDDLGRRHRSIQVVSGTATSASVEQVTQYVFDVRDRVIEVHRAVSSAAQDMGSDYATETGLTFAKVSATYFDEATAGSGTAGVGDGNVTSTRSYFGAGGGDYIATLFHYDWRNFLRGVKPAAAPYLVQDTDFMGRVIASALYTSEPTWATVVADDDYAQSVATNRGTLELVKFDKLGRVFQTATYEVAQAGSPGAIGDRLVADRFYDRNSRLVASYSNASGGAEYAFDGAGRMYQSRTVTELEATKYDGGTGAFVYRDPQPNPALASMTGGNDKVLTLSHVVFDAAGNVEQSIRLEANHTDTNGLEIDAGTKDYIQTASYSWFDGAHRLTDSAAYGTGDTNSGAGQWKYFALPTRPGSAPARSDEVLVTTYAFESASSRLSTVTDPKAVVTKLIYDDLGRRKYLIENYANFNESTEANTGDATDKSKDRVTKTVYNGLSQVTTLTALDPDGNGNLSDNQATKYLYENAYHADLTTSIIYPDSADTDSTGTDQIKIAHHLDGSPNTRTDQRGTVITYAYDSLRRLKASQVTTNGTGTDVTIKSITRAFDTLGRLQKVTSHGDVTDDPGDTDDVKNQVVLEYDDYGMLKKEYQEHDGVKDGSTLYVEHGFDDTADTGVFTKAYRLKHTIYPNSRKVHYTYGTGGSVSDLLSRLDAMKEDSSGSPGNAIITYTWNAVSTFVKKEMPTPAGTYTGDTLRMDYFGGTSGTYAGFDRFGRVTDHRWVTYSDPADDNSFADADSFRIQHGYDRASNKTYSDDQVYKSYSRVYSYDNLHRLKSLKEGQINSAQTDIMAIWKTQVADWTLDQQGNQTTATANVSESATRTINGANEYVTQKVKANSTTSLAMGKSSNFDAADFELPSGSSDAFSGTTNYVQITTVAQDTYDSQTEEEARAFILFGEDIGPHYHYVKFLIPSGTTSGQVGMVFGYKNPNDYWINVLDVAGYRRLYHVVNGQKQLKLSSSTSVPVGSWTGVSILVESQVFGSSSSYSYVFPDGVPSGRLGLYCTIQNVQFDSIIDYTAYNRKSLTDRWMTVSGAHINASSDRFEIASVVQSGTFLRDLRVNRFRMTFFAPGWNNYVAPAFHGKDFDTLDYVVIRPYINQTATASGRHVVGGNDTSASGTTSPLSAGSDFWFRLEFDGTTLTLKGKQGTSAPDESTWSSLGTLYSSTDFDFDGGYIGFLTGTVDTITIETDRDNNGSYETVEHIDHLTLDGSGFADSEPTHDPAGNLTYDGVHAFTYDAWNRLVKVTKAYRDPSSGNVTLGSVVNEIEHDGLGRRIVKQVKNSADLDCTYKYYHDGQRVIEERNGSDQVIKQHVWGALYIDELVQTGLNDDPTEDNTVDTFYFAIHDAMFNVIGLVDDEGTLVERYDYTPYGQRTVYTSAGTSDPDCHRPVLISRRWQVSSVDQPWGKLDLGFQGLMHDEESGLIHNRARMLHPRMGRFLQRDPLGYPDGLNGYAAYHVMHGGLDPSGQFDGSYAGHVMLGGAAPSPVAVHIQNARALRQQLNAELNQFAQRLKTDGRCGACDVDYEDQMDRILWLNEKYNNTVVAAQAALARGEGNTLEALGDANAINQLGNTGLETSLAVQKAWTASNVDMAGRLKEIGDALQTLEEGLAEAQKWLNRAEFVLSAGVSVRFIAEKGMCTFAKRAIVTQIAGQAVELGMDALGVDEDVRAYVRVAKNLLSLYNARKGECFPAGTIVHTKDGPKPIEEVEDGEWVLAYDHDLGRWKYCQVVDRFESEYDGDMVSVTFHSEDNAPTETLDATAGHPFWVARGDSLASRPLALEHAGRDAHRSPGGGRWVEARSLRLGDVLLLKNGKSATVVGLEVRRERLKVYNLEVARLHCYAVGEAGVLVHNACPSPNGKKGGEAHQSKVNEIEADIKSRGLEPKREYMVNTPDGEKSKRFVDIVGVDPKTGQVSEMYQVGRQTQRSPQQPVARERRAIDDIEKETRQRPMFVPYN